MSKIYSPQQMAERSLGGGTPVKGGPDRKSMKKQKMTPGKTECMLGEPTLHIPCYLLLS